MAVSKSMIASITYEVYDADTETKKIVTRYGKRFEVSPGNSVDLFPIRVLAEALGRTAQTIVIWEREGLFPVPMYKVTNHRCKRWYSRDQIFSLVELMRRFDFYKNKYFDKAGFLKEVRGHFYRIELEAPVSENV